MVDIILRWVPVSTRSLVATFLAIELLVTASALTMVILFFDEPLTELDLVVMTALAISGPIVWLMLSSLRHQRKLQDELLRLATTDVLTGLPNRRAFLEQVAPAGRFAQSGALVLADADHFKRINDTLGHDVGDLCLQALAARLTGLLAQGDVAARYGGEEFALFCPDATDDSLRGLETRLCHPVDVEIGDDGASVSVAMSAGAVLAERGASSIDAYRIADNALYEAKASGREKLVIATKVVHSPAAG